MIKFGFPFSLLLSLVSAFRSVRVQSLVLSVPKPALRASASCDVPYIDQKVIPVDYEGVRTQMLGELYNSIMDGKQDGTLKGAKFSIDVLTPGLNPKLENKIIVSTEKMFELVTSMLPVLASSFSTTMLMFQSMGDAAGYEKYLRQTMQELPSNIVATELSPRYISPDVPIECIVFIKARNHVGDPVLKEIQNIHSSTPDTALYFLNCDLSDQVTTGSMRKAQRDDFRESIKPCYYFRNIVIVSRPSLLPKEKGVLLYTKSPAWRLFACEDDDIIGSGSLNRYLDKAVFKPHEKCTISAANPPRMIQCATFDRMPKRDQLSDAMEKGSFLLAKRRRIEKGGEEGEGGFGWFSW